MFASIDGPHLIKKGSIDTCNLEGKYHGIANSSA